MLLNDFNIKIQAIVPNSQIGCNSSTIQPFRQYLSCFFRILNEM